MTQVDMNKNQTIERPEPPAPMTLNVADPLIQFFAYAHLPEHLQTISKPFGQLADVIMTLPRNPERTVALRKLLEAKDCAVRAGMYRAPAVI